MLLAIGARFGAVGSSVLEFVIVAPPPAVIVAVKLKVFVPAEIAAPFQCTAPPERVQAGEQLPTPVKETPVGIVSLMSAVNAAPGFETWSV